MTARAPNAIRIRATDASDAGAVVALLRMRDELDHPAEAVTAYLMDLDPEHLLGWVAYAGDRPVGLNTLYVRHLNWCGERVKAGYWAHLFVDPDYRKAMVYTQLVAAMLRASRDAGLGLIYTATRRSQVVEAHTKLGFSPVGTLRVPFKPLRPGRLIAKRQEVTPVLEKLSVPVDALFGAWVAARRPRTPPGISIEAPSFTTPEAESVVGLLSAARADVFQEWDPAILRRRFATTIEGWPYSLLVARRSGQIEACVIHRMAERGARRIRAGVVMDVLGAERAPGAARALLAEAERRAFDEGAEGMLALDGAGPATRGLLKSLGYRTSPETYYLLVWPRTRLSGEAADLARWRFAFADHDAF